MSEQEYDGLTLEGLAQRVEALERGEAGKDQTGEETAAEFVRPPSRPEQGYDGMTLQALAHRLEMLEQENALLRERARFEARDVSTFDVLQCEYLQVDRSASVPNLRVYDTASVHELVCDYLRVHHVTLTGNQGLHVRTTASGTHPAQADWPNTAISGLSFARRTRGVVGMGIVGVWGVGTSVFDGGPEPAIGMLGEGDDIGVQGKATRPGGPGDPAIGVLGESTDIGVKGIVTRQDGLPFNVARYGVVGVGPQTGVLGQGEGVGVQGISTRQDGLPFTKHGVLGQGRDSGVRGTSNEGAGVWGSGANGVFGQGIPAADASEPEGSQRAYGGVFETRGDHLAQLRLVPGNKRGAPNARSHRQGELYMDSEGALFVCTDDGTPGSWSKFTMSPA
jgi:hypothetical protein